MGGGGTSSEDGTGVGDTVVFRDWIFSTGPT